ncbi:MAG: FkbM family methyltransferase [Methylobacter sp.]
MLSALKQWFRNRRAVKQIAAPQEPSGYAQKLPEQVHLHWHVSDITQIPAQFIWYSPRAIEINALDSTPQAASQSLAYDPHLLDNVRIQWQFGDWDSLVKLQRDCLEAHPERAKLALLVAAGHSQVGDMNATRDFVQLARDWGCDKQLISQVLVAGVYNTLGRATLALGDRQRALGHYKTAATVINQKANASLLADTQMMRETLRLDVDQQVAKQIQPPETPALPTPAKPDVGITSYAQNFEDVMLWRALGRIENGFYIDVCAHDPVVDSVSKAFYEHGWRGIHVEPLPEYAAAIRQDRPDERVVEAVLAAQAGTQTYYHIPKTGLSTGSKEFATRHQKDGWKVNEITVPAITLATLFDEVGSRPIHWLKIDVEGMEADVLTGWGTHLARPWVVVVGATEPNSQTTTCHLWESFLLDRDYTFVYFDGLNRFYVSGHHPELNPVFAIPPNVFDGFRKV